jgi:hypothetical protein
MRWLLHIGAEWGEIGGHTMRQHEGENEGRDGKQKEQRERETTTLSM